jgi:hypothetical protein
MKKIFGDARSVICTIDEFVGNLEWFMQGCAPPSYAAPVCHWLDETFSGWRICRKWARQLYGL